MKDEDFVHGASHDAFILHPFILHPSSFIFLFSGVYRTPVNP
jgi:hypothetical protein